MVDFKQRLTEDNTEPNTAFLNQLRKKLPEFFTRDKYDIDENGNEVLVESGGFDIQKFQDHLSKHNVNEITDGYTLNFVGKKYAELQTGKPTTTVVIPDVKHNEQQNNSQSENVFLTGNNLDVLKHLQRAYTNSIDMIYIDPPYNTGSDGFVYNDKFDLSDEDLRDTFNMSEDEIKKLHLLNGRSSHSAWLTFMYPRLKIAQQLLKDSGVIFVSIDDNEQANLKLLMDDVFGGGNFVSQIIWKGKGGGQDSTHFVPVYESIFVYAKNINEFELGIDFVDEDESAYSLFDEQRSLKYKRQLARKWGSNARREDRPNLYFGVTAPDKSIVYPHLPDGTDGRWRHSQARLQLEIERGDFEFVKDEKTNNWVLYQKIFASRDGRKAKKFTNLIDDISSGSGTKYVQDLFDNKKVFDYPKPVALVKRFLNMIDNDDIIALDFFAGSSTTADAVMQLNAEDGGNRKWILNTLDEKTPDDSAARQAGYLTIDEISRERIKRAGEKIQKEHPKLDNFDVGFKHYYVKEIDAKTVDTIAEFDPNSTLLLTDDVVSEFSGHAVNLGKYYDKSDKDKENPKFANVIDTDATGSDTILNTWLINDGYKFDVQVETIELIDNNVHYVEDGALVYIIDNFTQEDVEALLNLIGTQKLNVKTIIVFGYSFDFATMTSLKNNVKTVLDGVRVEVRY